MKKDINRVRLRGLIYGMSHNPQSSIITLAVDSRIGAGNYPKVFILDKNMIKGFSINDRVEVIGTAQQSQLKGDDGKYHSVTMITAQTIEPAKRRLLDYFKKEDIVGETGGNSSDKNELLFVGNLKDIYIVSDSFKKISIETNDGETPKQVTISCFPETFAFLETASIGDRIAIVGEIQTNKRKKNGIEEFMQNVVCKDIAFFKE